MASSKELHRCLSLGNFPSESQTSLQRWKVQVHKGQIQIKTLFQPTNSVLYDCDSLYSTVKVHVLITGETFSSHLAFMQKLKLQRERDCSPEKCDIILLFCPVASQIGTDMEAAMARVPENKPVILVFMHHCHSPSHMTNITVQPSRGNIVQVVHCAYHESTGLLRCQENEQAVAKVEATLKKYK